MAGEVANDLLLCGGGDGSLESRETYLSRTTSTTTIFVFEDGVVMQACNAVVRSMSNVFAAMLESGMLEARTGIVCVQACSSECFRALLTWAHGVHGTNDDSADDTMQDVNGSQSFLHSHYAQAKHLRGIDGRDLWDMADTYDFESLRTLLLNTVSPSNVCAAMQHALNTSHDALDLFEECLKTAMAAGCLHKAMMSPLQDITPAVIRHTLHAHRRGGKYGTEALSFVTAWCSANNISPADLVPKPPIQTGKSSAKCDVRQQGALDTVLFVMDYDKDDGTTMQGCDTHKAQAANCTDEDEDEDEVGDPNIDKYLDHDQSDMDVNHVAKLLEEAARLTCTDILCRTNAVNEHTAQIWREIIHGRSTGGDTWGKLCEFAHEKQGGLRIACKDASFCVNVAVLPDGAFVMIDWMRFGVHVYGANFKYERQIGSHGEGHDQYTYPYAVAVSKRGHIIVSDYQIHRVLVYTRFGSLLCVLGAQEQLSFPTGVAVCERDDLVYVCDSSNHRVQVFEVTGTLVRAFAADPCGGLRFRRMKGIAVSGCTVAVACIDVYTQSSSVVMYTAHGQLLRVIGAGTLLSVPNGVCMSRGGDVVVTDQTARRLLFFDQYGTLLRDIGGSEGTSFGSPSGVAIAKDGSLFVTDFFDSCVKIFRPACAKASITGVD